MSVTGTQLRLWQRVIFIDWHGVLSREPFWSSIRERPSHPLYERLEQQFAAVVAPTMPDWMRGHRSAETIVRALDLNLGHPYSDDFLLRRLQRDCRRMGGDPQVLEILRPLNSQAMLVVATDNADCFADAFTYSATRARSGPVNPAGLAAWARASDGLLCSSELGTLKAEHAQGFFGPWLRENGLGFAGALLIDDRADNCRAFERCGGTAIRWNLGVDSVGELEAQVREWLHLAVETPSSGGGEAA
jgi:hypothetical protein